MAINENTGPELEEYQQQPPATLTRCTLSNSTIVSTPYNVYQRQNQQEESNSPSDFTHNNINSPSNFTNNINNPSGSILSLSNIGNQSLSNKDNLNSTSAVETVEKEIAVQTVEEAITFEVEEEITSEVKKNSQRRKRNQS